MNPAAVAGVAARPRAGVGGVKACGATLTGSQGQVVGPAKRVLQRGHLTVAARVAGTHRQGEVRQRLQPLCVHSQCWARDVLRHVHTQHTHAGAHRYTWTYTPASVHAGAHTCAHGVHTRRCTQHLSLCCPVGFGTIGKSS